MQRARRQAWTTILLLAFLVRAALGAPCCLDMSVADEPAQLHHSANAHAKHAGMDASHGKSAAHEDQGHAGHGDDPAANPCCSACGPTLPPEPGAFLARIALHSPPEPAAIHALPTRPPFPAYEATGPPLTV